MGEANSNLFTESRVYTAGLYRYDINSFGKPGVKIDHNPHTDILAVYPKQAPYEIKKDDVCTLNATLTLSPMNTEMILRHGYSDQDKDSVGRIRYDPETNSTSIIINNTTIGIIEGIFLKRDEGDINISKDIQHIQPTLKQTALRFKWADHQDRYIQAVIGASYANQYLQEQKQPKEYKGAAD